MIFEVEKDENIQAAISVMQNNSKILKIFTISIQYLFIQFDIGRKEIFINILKR